MSSRQFIRAVIAVMWLYQGLWCKVLGRAPHDQAVVASVPFLGPGQVHGALLLLGALECGIALWVLWGYRARQAAIVQTVLLVAMNGGALVWAAGILPDPAGMLLQNLAFLTLAWIAAGELRPYDP